MDMSDNQEENMLKFTKDHEWISIDGNSATIGITHYAQEQLGDVVFVDLPAIGKVVAVHGEAAVVESVKAASDVYSPVAGTITMVNDALSADPSLVNSAAESSGWFFKLDLADASQLDGLMDRAAYDAYLTSL
jgi:glycine cleavage system H protein